MDLNLIVILTLAFLAVTGVSFAGAQFYLGRAQLKRRMPGTAGLGAPSNPVAGLGSIVVENFTEARFGVDTKLRQKLRRDLLRAGYFSNDAIRYYVFARFCSVVVLPISVFVLTRIFLPQTGILLETVMISVAAIIGILGPDAFLSRRQGKLMREYRQIFPDLLDLLTVCVTAGLSLEASFDRIRGQMGQRSRALGQNLELMGAEMRAGRSSSEALSSFADRLGLDEAASFVVVLRHSLELGGDVSDSLRVFSEEMRDKRMLRAEETANSLPVKMVLPLALGIFPVILEIVMLPVMLKLLSVFNR